MLWRIIVVGLAVGLAGCNGQAVQGVLNGVLPGVEATVVVRPGEGVKCDLSSKPREVSCHVLSEQDKASDTAAPVASSDGAVVIEPPPISP